MSAHRCGCTMGGGGDRCPGVVASRDQGLCDDCAEAGHPLDDGFAFDVEQARQPVPTIDLRARLDRLLSPEQAETIRVDLGSFTLSEPEQPF